jgi:hypothetical protein
MTSIVPAWGTKCDDGQTIARAQRKIVCLRAHLNDAVGVHARWALVAGEVAALRGLIREVAIRSSACGTPVPERSAARAREKERGFE